MAAYLNRTVSMMAGDGPHNKTQINNISDHRLIRTTNDNSPLQIFVKAKKKINDIFVEIEDYVKDAVTYMHSKHLLNYLFVLQHLLFDFSCRKGAKDC